ncbi:MAG: NAD(P)H-dependent flavin oxidoreductase [Holosporales bacterium]
MSGRTQFEKLSKRGCDFLGVQFPILGGAMTWVSERSLTSAISNAGGFGVLACGAMTPELLRAEIEATRELTSKPFGLNLITLHPRLLELIDVCGDLKVSHVVLAGGVPSQEAMERVKATGAKLICFAPALVMAKRLIKNGVDALVIEGHEAGGHIGPVSTSVLVQEILPHIQEVPIFVAGGIGRGEAIALYLSLGAAGCQLGTRFVCAKESRAHPHFKKAFMRGHARDAVVSPQLDPRFPVIPVRALANEGTKRFIEFQRQMIDAVDRGEKELKDAQMEIEHFWAGALRRAVVDGDVENGSLMAGQSVGMVKSEQTVQEILNELVDEAMATLESRLAL